MKSIIVKKNNNYALSTKCFPYHITLLKMHTCIIYVGCSWKVLETGNLCRKGEIDSWKRDRLLRYISNLFDSHLPKYLPATENKYAVYPFSHVKGISFLFICLLCTHKFSPCRKNTNTVSTLGGVALTHEWYTTSNPLTRFLE